MKTIGQGSRADMFRQIFRTNYRHFQSGVITSILLAFFSLYAEESLGRTLPLFANEIRGTLTNTSLPNVIIVDVTQIPQVTASDERANSSRSVLRHIVRALSAARPRAIGIDIDFSPLNAEHADQSWSLADSSDPDFFEFCLSYDRSAKNVDLAQSLCPVVLGVGRQATRDHTAWLGFQGFAPLAGHVYIADAPRISASLWLLREASRPLPGLASAMVWKARGEIPRPTRWPSRLAYAIESPHTPSPGLIEERLFVDCTRIPALARSNRVIHLTANDYARIRSGSYAFDAELLKGKYVLIGMADVDNAKDNAFHVAGDWNHAFPGVFMHAAILDTIERDYLYVPGLATALIMDIVLSVVVFALILFTTSVVIFFSPDHPVTSDASRWSILFAGAICALLMGTVFVRQTYLLWDGCFLVAIALLAHPLIERTVIWTARRWPRSRAENSLSTAIPPLLRVTSLVACGIICGLLLAPAHEPITLQFKDTPDSLAGRIAATERGGDDRTSPSDAIFACITRIASGDQRWSSWSDLAAARLRRGQDDDVLRASEEARLASALTGTSRAWQPLYNLACAQARLGQRVKCIDTLRNALRIDAEVAATIKRQAANDSDFDSVGKDPDFIRLVH